MIVSLINGKEGQLFIHIDILTGYIDQAGASEDTIIPKDVPHVTISAY